MRALLDSTRNAIVASWAVREVGSHDELMAAGGLYAELYQLQSQAYR